MFIVHYHAETGQISAWGNGWSESSHIPGHEVIAFTDEQNIDPKVDRIDVATGERVKKTPAEIAIEATPRLFEVEWLVKSELNATDALMAPDRTVPDRDEWTVYRQALRDISKQPDVDAMIDAWPARPDSLDVIGGLRLRLAAARDAKNEGTPA